MTGPVTQPVTGRSSSIVDGLGVIRRTPVVVDPGLPVIVLVHGAMDRAASFSRTMRRLDRYDLIALDRRGYSTSNDAGVSPTIAAHAQDLASVIEWSGASRVVVVGHSLGGTIALALAAASTSAGVADGRIVAMGAFESPMPSLDGSYDEVGGGAVEIGQHEGPAAAAEHFYRLMVGDEVWGRLRETDRAARLAEGPALLAELIDLRSPERAVDLAQVKVPTVVGLGGRSSSRLGERAVALATHLGHRAPVTIASAGHGAHLTHPDEFARYVEGIIELADDESLR